MTNNFLFSLEQFHCLRKRINPLGLNFSFKKNLCAIILFATFFFTTSIYSQARFNIFNGAYATMSGGSSSSPIYLVIENGNANAISRTTSGHIISENEYNKVKWQMGTNTGNHIFHFGKGTVDYMPFTVNVSSAGTCPSPPCSYTASTYYTLDNVLWPSGVTNIDPGEAAAVDRFWVTGTSGYTTVPIATARFYYLTSELDGLTEVNLQAQMWNSAQTAWDSPIGTVDVPSKYVEVATISPIAPWTLVNTSNPLPIELLTFTATWKNKEHTEALIKWQTATEINNDYFNVERSIDGILYETIGKLNGAGNSSITNHYSLVDQFKSYILSTPSGNGGTTFYYRLKQVDYDGKYSYSNIVPLTTEDNNLNTISVFPNPTMDFVNIDFASTESNNAEITITNTLSQIVLHKKINLGKGESFYKMDVSTFAKGIYNIKVTQNNLTTVNRLVKD